MLRPYDWKRARRGTTVLMLGIPSISRIRTTLRGIEFFESWCRKSLGNPWHHPFDRVPEVGIPRISRIPQSTQVWTKPKKKTPKRKESILSVENVPCIPGCSGHDPDAAKSEMRKGAGRVGVGDDRQMERNQKQNKTNKQMTNE